MDLAGSAGWCFASWPSGPSDFDVVAINDLSDPKHLALLLKYDSVQGRFKGTVTAREKSIVVNGKEIPITTEKDPARSPLEEAGLPGRPGIDRAVHRSRQPAKAHRRRRRASGLERPGQGRPRRHDRAGRQRQDLEQEPPHHLQRVVHDQLPGAPGQGLARDVRHRKRADDDRARLHERSARGRPGARRPVPRPRGRGEHHSVQDRRGQGRRRGHSRTQGQADRLRLARAGARRLGRRPDRPAENQLRPATRSTRPSRRPPKDRSRASSNTRPTPWCRATSSATRIRASSSPSRP